MDSNKVEFVKNNDYQITVKTYGQYYIECCTEPNNTFYKDIFTLLPRNMNRLVEDKKSFNNILEKITQESREKTNQLFEKCDSKIKKSSVKGDPMNILMIVIDSFSHNHAKRMIPLTYDYLKSWKQDNQIFENYVIIGENTKPNIFPLLTGRLVLSSPSNGLVNEDPGKNYNLLPLFWKDFERLGYISMYNEDFLINGN